MMKKLFFLLLLANFLVLLGARYLVPPPQNEAARRSGGNIEFLTSETLTARKRMKDEAEPIVEAQAEPIAEVEEPAELLTEEQAEPVTEEQAEPRTEAQAKPIAEEQAEPLTGEQAESHVEEQAESLADEQSQPNLVQEGAAVVDSQDDIRTKIVSDLSLGENECLTLGPLDTRELADAFASDLAQQNMAGFVRSGVILETKSYLVLLPTASRAEASRTMRQLAESGHKDVWQLTSGEHKGEVSVGLFRNESNAQFRLEQITKDGFSAKVVPRSAERRAFWVDLRAEPSSRVTPEFIDALRGTYPLVTAERKRCRRPPL